MIGRCSSTATSVLCALGDEEPKRALALGLLKHRPWISTQVVNECSHVLRRKAGWPVRRVTATLSDILHLVRLTEVGIDDIRSAWALAERYGYSHYDSLIITAALRAGCATLYSEDLQHSQLIDGRLEIVNPFLTSTSP